MDSRWIQHITPAETAQLKLCYAVIYESLYSTSFEQDAWDSIVQNLATDSRRFPPLKALKLAFTKSIGKISREVAGEKFIWMCRDNSDKVLIRYIRQEDNLCRAMSCIGGHLRWLARHTDLEDMAAKGDCYDQSEEFFCLNKFGLQYVAGEDLDRRPLVLVKGDQRPFFFRSKVIDKQRNFFFEQLQLLLQDHTDGATFLYDFTHFPDSANIEAALARFLSTLCTSQYPMIAARIIIHCAPRSLQQTTWKAIAPLIKSQLRNRVVFTTRTSELMEFINLEQLPKSVGGYSEYEYEYIRPQEDATLTPPPLLLVGRKQALTLEIKALTILWIKSRMDLDNVEHQRAVAMQEYERLYWQLDRYVRKRTMIDRSGMAAILRPETVGNAARRLDYVEDCPSRDTLSSVTTYDGQSVYTMDNMSMTSKRSKMASVIGSTLRAVRWRRS